MVIAVAEMSDLQRRIVRLHRPIQHTAMRVLDYYKRFCDWKEEMICIGHPDDEASYIDDFIGNLQWHIRLRVSERRSSMSRLIDAYYAANFNETMILVEEVIKDLRARNVIDEMTGQIPIEILGADICDSAEEKFVEKKHQTEAISTSTIAFLQSPPINEDPNSAISTEIPVVEVIRNSKQLEMAECWELEENDGSVCGKIAVQNEAGKVFDEMSWDVESQPNVKPNGVQQVENLFSVTPIAEILKEQVNEPYAHYLFDELPRPFLVEQSDRNAGNVGKEADVLPFVDLQSALSSEYEANVNGSINGSTKAWFEEATSIMEVVLGKNAIEDDAYKVFDEMTQTIRAVLLNEQVTDLYTNKLVA